MGALVQPLTLPFSQSSLAVVGRTDVLSNKPKAWVSPKMKMGTCGFFPPPSMEPGPQGALRGVYTGVQLVS